MMRLFPSCVLLLIGLCAVRAGEPLFVDGSKLPADKQFPKQNVVKRYRPWVMENHRGELVVENLRIHDVTNQKAIDIGLMSDDRPTPVPGEPLTFGRVIVRNIEIAGVNRDEVGTRLGEHIDFLRIAGGGDRQPFPTSVLVENVVLRDGNALPLLIQEGKFSTITLRRVRIENTTVGSAQIGVINQGRIERVIIEDCPGLPVQLMGRPGSIEECIVRNSPGAIIRDPLTPNGQTGVRIIYEKAAAPRPQGVVLASSASTRPAAVPQLRAQLGPDGAIQLKVEGIDPDATAHITFEAFDSFNYRMCDPVILMKPPWQAKIKSVRFGRITCQAVITRLGGDPGAVLTAEVNVPAVQGASSMRR